MEGMAEEGVGRWTEDKRSRRGRASLLLLAPGLWRRGPLARPPLGLDLGGKLLLPHQLVRGLLRRPLLAHLVLLDLPQLGLLLPLLPLLLLLIIDYGLLRGLPLCLLLLLHPPKIHGVPDRRMSPART